MLQLKQVTLDGLIAGTSDGLRLGVIESLTSNSARNGLFTRLGANSIPRGSCDVNPCLTSLDSVNLGRQCCVRSVLGKS